MSAEECSGIQFKHGSLKDILEELGKLHNTESTKKNVFNHLKSGLGTYCGDTYLDAFYKIQSGGLSSGYIQAVTYAGYDTCRQLLKSPPSWDGRSDNRHADHPDCIQKYAEALKACLPKAFSALYYLYFMCSTECSGIGGGSWSSSRVNGSGQNLNKWLTESSDSGLITRGFSNDTRKLTHNTGKNVAEKLKSAVSLTLGRDDGALQNVLCGFMFVCKWDPALTGHAICFLDKFCSKVSQDSGDLLKGQYKDHSGAFKEVCKGLKSDLQPFIFGTSGLFAVCHDNTNLFDSLWDNDKFLTYCTWLKDNLDKIIQSLASMSQESSQWSSDHLVSGSSAGPFKYGFVYKASWTSGSTSKSTLQDCISKLTGSDSGSLQKFKTFLFNPSTPSSAGATAAGAAGGIFGLGGAGAGAAYATNAFGLKDIISGLISSFLK